MLGPTTRPSQRVIALDDTPLGAKRRSRASGFVHGREVDGGFRRDLPPGTYELRAHASSQLIWARTVTARVRAHQIKRATITFVPRHPLPVAPGSASG